jgi:hypothetical protein
MTAWIANFFRVLPERVWVFVLGRFTREPEDGVTLQARIIEVHPPGLGSDVRVELRMHFDDCDEWYTVGEISIEHAEAFSKLLHDVAMFPR